MPQSLSNILLHIVFSTKNRLPLLTPNIASELYAYIATISHTHGCPVHHIGGTNNHLHICCSLARTQTCAKLVEEIKTDSSKWMKTKDPALTKFSWQNGYGSFSVAEDQLNTLKSYIINQPQHHTMISFEDEFRELLRRHGISFDEQYVWD